MVLETKQIMRQFHMNFFIERVMCAVAGGINLEITVAIE